MQSSISRHLCVLLQHTAIKSALTQKANWQKKEERCIVHVRINESGVESCLNMTDSKALNKFPKG